jgi:hypothetical protein
MQNVSARKIRIRIKRRAIKWAAKAQNPKQRYGMEGKD